MADEFIRLSGLLIITFITWKDNGDSEHWEQGKVTSERTIEKGTFYFISKQGGLCPREPPAPVSQKMYLISFRQSIFKTLLSF